MPVLQPQFDVYLVKEVEKSIKKNQVSEREIKAIQEMATLDNPARNTKFMNGIYQGQREKRFGDRRMLFAVCEECRRLEHNTKYNQCSDCTNMPDNGLKIFYIGKHL